MTHAGANQGARDEIAFPPFAVEHLEESLDHLSALATG